MTPFQWFALASIVVVAFGGGMLPFLRHEEARRVTGFPRGQAFSAGVFLALAVLFMLPNAFQLFHDALPEVNFPLAAMLMVCSYVFLLALGHIAVWEREHDPATAGGSVLGGPPAIPIIMTVMIAIPSFLLGAALGLSRLSTEIVIYLAILAHKGTAAFALALTMVRSRMSRRQSLLVFSMFVCSTPLGILVGADVRDDLTGHVMMLAQAVVFSLAGGVFLFMATLHELKHAPLIVNCCTRKGFLWMLLGLSVTSLVRLVLGLAGVG